MGPGETTSLIALVGLLIAVLIAGTQMFKRFMPYTERQLAATAEKAARYATDNTALERRMRVIERIVTDRGYDVAIQIEALRDARRVEGPAPAGLSETGQVN